MRTHLALSYPRLAMLHVRNRLTPAPTPRPRICRVILLSALLSVTAVMSCVEANATKQERECDALFDRCIGGCAVRGGDAEACLRDCNWSKSECNIVIQPQRSPDRPQPVVKPRPGPGTITPPKSQATTPTKPKRPQPVTPPKSNPTTPTGPVLR